MLHDKTEIKMLKLITRDISKFFHGDEQYIFCFLGIHAIGKLRY